VSPVRVKYFTRSVERSVHEKSADLITKAVIVGENRSKEIITELGRIDTGLMRATTTHEVDRRKLIGRYGSPIKPKPPAEHGYPVYQELGTSKISPGFFYRGALEHIKRIFPTLR
jgi:hypothetical protein